MRKFEIISKYLNKEVNIPIRATKKSAGYDLECADEITINPGEIKLVNTGLKVKLNDDEAFLFDSHCYESYKGKGLHTCMNYFRLKYISEYKKTKALGLVLFGNKPALKVQNKSDMHIKNIVITYYCRWLNINKIRFIKYDN